MRGGLIHGDVVEVLRLEGVSMLGLGIPQVDVGVLRQPFSEVMVQNRSKIGYQQQSNGNHRECRDSKPGQWEP